MTTDEKIQIIAGAVTNCIGDLFPGADNARGIKQLKKSHTKIFSEGHCRRAVSAGIGIWHDADVFLDDGPPSEVIPWKEIIDVVQRGCTGGRRERYEAAHEAFCEQANKELPEPWIPAYLLEKEGRSTDWFYESKANQAHWEASERVHRELDDARMAIIEAGCARQTLQPELF